MKKALQYSILALSIFALLISLLIHVEKTQADSVVAKVCLSLSNGGCQQVQASPYSKIFGIDTQIYGIAGFLLLSALCVLNLKWPKRIFEILIFAGSLFAGLAGISLIGIQAFIIHSYCFFCMLVDIASLFLFAISFLWMRSKMVLSEP